MRLAGRLFRLMPVLVGAALAASCQHVTGPSLSAKIESQRLVPTSTVQNADQICCCHIQGTITNTSPIAAHISLRWTVFDKAGAQVATATDFLTSVASGATKPYDSVGIDKPCNLVGNFTPNVLVVGLFDAHK